MPFMYFYFEEKDEDVTTGQVSYWVINWRGVQSKAQSDFDVRSNSLFVSQTNTMQFERRIYCTNLTEVTFQAPLQQIHTWLLQSNLP